LGNSSRDSWKKRLFLGWLLVSRKALETAELYGGRGDLQEQRPSTVTSKLEWPEN
jgi:hypothetical protein